MRTAMRLDLADLRLFLSIIDAGSITQGAIQANLALASASERLRNIEESAGVQLLVRHPRGVLPTEAGAALAHHARVMLRQNAQMQHELQSFACGNKGTVSLYANTAAITSYLPSKLATWLADRPAMNIDLKERTSTEIVRAVSAGLIEAGIVSDAVQAPGLQLQAVAQDKLVAIVPVNHPFAASKTTTLNTMCSEYFVGLPANSALQQHIEQHAARLGKNLLFRIRVPAFSSLCQMVSQGIGVSIIPQNIATQYRRRYPHRQIALTDSWTQRHLCLCFRDWDTLSAPVKELLTFFSSHSDTAHNL